MFSEFMIVFFNSSDQMVFARIVILSNLSPYFYPREKSTNIFRYVDGKFEI